MRTLTRSALAATAIAGLLTAAGSTGTAHATPAASTAQTIRLHYNSAVSEQIGQAIARGPIAGVGTEVEDFGGTGGQATLTFADGSVVIDVVIAAEVPTFNPAACMMQLAQSGSWSIDHGTGAYAAATGDGGFTGTRTIHGTRIEGACQGPDSGVEPRLVTDDVLLTGTVSPG